jgi:hypothetical protein
MWQGTGASRCHCERSEAISVKVRTTEIAAPLRS